MTIRSTIFQLAIICMILVVGNPYFIKLSKCHGNALQENNNLRLCARKRRDAYIEQERIEETRNFLSHSLLTVEDEKQLAVQYQLGLQLKTQFDFLEKAHNFSYAINQITSKLEISQPQLLLLIRQGEVAKKVLARANSRLVYHIADVFRRRGASMSNLIHYASEGLFKAIDRFDPDRGFRFSTYASWWIKQAITRNLYEKANTALILQKKVARFESDFEAENERSPTIREISEGLKVSMKKIREAMRAVKVHKISLDAPAYTSSKGSNQKRTIQDITASVDIASTQASFNSLAESEYIMEYLKTIPQEDANILMMRYGLDDGTPKSVEEVRQQFKVSRGRIRQLEESALLNLQLMREQSQ